MRIELSIPFKISNIPNISAIKIPQRFNSFTVNSITTDSRIASCGDLFIALDGENYRGCDYIDDAIEKGCMCVSSIKRDDCIFSESTVDFLSSLATYYKSLLTKLKYTIAITGSVGKSTTKELIKQLLASYYKTHATHENMNNHIGLPLTILSAAKDTEILILEMGMNHTGEIAHLSLCAAPDISIITNIGTSHIGNLGTRENIASAKLEIKTGMNGGHMLIPYDEPLLRGIPGTLSVSANKPLANFNLTYDKNSVNFKSHLGEINDIKYNTYARHIVYNLSFAISAAQLAGMDSLSIKKALESFSSLDLRQRFIQLEDYTILDDSYNSSYESLIADFEMVSNMASENHQPIGAFLGDILELGEMGPYIHYKVGKAAVGYGIKNLYLYGDLSKYTAKGAVNAGFDPSRIYINTSIIDPSISIKQISENHFPGELILIKGSHKLRMDRIADMIEYQERSKNDKY